MAECILVSNNGTSGQSFSFSNDGKFRYPEDVVIPANVTSFTNSESSFYNHSEVGNILFESGSALTVTGVNAFTGCSGLKSIVFPATLTNIGNQAFYGCSSLSDIVIPAAVTNIGQQAFLNCTSLKNITWSMGSSTVTLGQSAFQNSGVIDDDLITIFNRSYIVYSNLFQNCLSLKNINVPMTWTYMFMNCTNMKTAVIGNGANSGNLGDGAFNGCTSLTTVTIRARTGGQTLGIAYFANCRALKTVIFEGQVYCNNFTTTSGNNPFYGCTALEDLQVPEGWTENLLLSNGTANFTNVLTHDSLVAMIANLYDYSDGDEHTLTLGTINLERLSTEEKVVATAKNWTLV